MNYGWLGGKFAGGMPSFFLLYDPKVGFLSKIEYFYEVSSRKDLRSFGERIQFLSEIDSIAP